MVDDEPAKADGMPDREPGGQAQETDKAAAPVIRLSGCRSCCLAALAVVALVAGFFAYGISRVGTEAPPVTPLPGHFSGFREMTVSTNLDRANPTAVATFSVQCHDAGRDWPTAAEVEVIASVPGDGAPVASAPASATRIRLTLFSGDGTALPTDTDPTPADLSLHARPDGPVRAILELFSPPPGQEVETDLYVRANADCGEPAGAAVTSAAELRIVAQEPLARRRVAVLDATRTVSVPLGSAPHQRFAINSTGAAMPRTAGGQAYQALAITPTHWNLANPESEYGAEVYFSGARPDAFWSWYWNPAAYSYRDWNPGRAAGPASLCDRAQSGCTLNLYWQTFVGWAAANNPMAPDGSHVEFEIDVRDYFLDSVAVPSAATLTLTGGMDTP